jgi:hypothetical protein
LTGIAHFRAQILHAGKHGIEGTEMGSCVIGDDPRQGGLSDPGWAMQNQISDTVS